MSSKGKKFPFKEVWGTLGRIWDKLDDALKRIGLDSDAIVFLASPRANAAIEEIVGVIKKHLIIDSKIDANIRKLDPDDQFYRHKVWWVNFYRERMGITLDPDEIKYFPRWFGGAIGEMLIIVASGVTYKQVIAECRKRFNLELSIDEDLDSVLSDDRDSRGGSYAIFVRDDIQADDEFKGMSALTLIAKGHKGITLLERLLLEIIVYEFSQSRWHVDGCGFGTETLCVGSRFGKLFPHVGEEVRHGGGRQVSVRMLPDHCADDQTRSRRVC